MLHGQSPLTSRNWLVGGGEPTTTHQRAGSMWAFAGHGPITPEVAFLIQAAPINRGCWIASPRFRGWIPCFAGSSQAGFCAYTLPRIVSEEVYPLTIFKNLTFSFSTIGYTSSFLSGDRSDRFYHDPGEPTLGRP